MGEVVIDLDRVAPPAPAELDPPPWARLTRRHLRAILAGLLVLAGALLLGGAAAPRPPRFTAPVLIADAAPDNFAIGPGAVYVRSGSGHLLRRYSLDGSLRWSVPDPVDDGPPPVVTGDLVLITTSRDPGVTVAVEQSNGAVRWRAAGAVFAVTAEVVVLNVGGRGTFMADRVVTLAGVDVRDGSPRWDGGVPRAGFQQPLFIGRALSSTGWQTGGLGRVNPDGTGELLDFRTGRWRPVTGVPVAPQSGAGFQYGMASAELTAVFSSDRVGSGDVRVFGPDGGAPLWIRKWRGNGGGSVCGPWVCLQDGTGSVVLDAYTGEVVARADWPQVVAAGPLRMFGKDGTVGITRIAVLDTGSGRVIRDYYGWDALPTGYEAWVPLVRLTDGLRWELASLGLQDGVAYRLNVISLTDIRDCRASATHVACPRRGNGGVLIQRYVPRS